jgi:aminoethylphosphonate catabolism LysR family transcriptional regulator
MNYSQLRAFHWVATEGGVGLAARRLALTQPAVSLQIRALEKAYGVDLFHRTARRVVLTEAGRSLFELTRRFFGVEREAHELLESIKGLRRGTLRIAADGPYHVIGILAELKRRHPGLEVAVTVGNSRQVRQSLLDYESDVAVMAVEPGDERFHCVPFRRHDIVVFVAASHPWWERKRVRLADLEGMPMVRREQGSATRAAFEKALQRAGVKPRFVLEIGSREAVREAVAAGIGAGVVSEAELGHDDRLRAIRITDGGVSTGEYLLCLAERASSRAIQAFFESAKETLGLRSD